MPGGHLVLCMLNPYGPMGILKFPMQLFSRQAQYRFHNLRMSRVIDWLSLLNFHVVEIEHGAYNPPLNSPRWVEHDSPWERACQKIRFPLGNIYMIHAVKRVPRGIKTTRRYGSVQPIMVTAPRMGLSRLAMIITAAVIAVVIDQTIKHLPARP